VVEVARARLLAVMEQGQGRGPVLVGPRQPGDDPCQLVGVTGFDLWPLPCEGSAGYRLLAGVPRPSGGG
jgi:hypothetical protein